MTATLDRPSAAPAPAPRAATPPPAPRGGGEGLAAAFGARTTAGRTFRTWLGLLLGITPLFMIIDDARWYVVGVGATIVAVGPAWALRWWLRDQPARVWQLLPGLILLPFYLTAVCLPTGATFGVIPSRVTWTQLSIVHDQLVDTVAKSTAPIESTPGVRLALAALLGLGVLMVDTLCTVLEAPTMVGLVLLPILVLSGATVRQPVALWWFALAAAGYLLILTTAGPGARPWGRAIGRRPPGAPPSLVSGRTIGVVAVLVALVVPLVAYDNSGNPIADALHTNGGSGGTGGNGTGGVAQLASLKGSLTRGEPIDLMTVKVPTTTKVEPFYLRQSVLDLFTGDGWIPAGTRTTSALARTGLAQVPPRPAIATTTFKADINVSGLSGRPVTFTDTTGAAGLPTGTDWDPGHGTFASGTVGKGTRYTVAVAQPDPTQEQLAAATGALPPGFPGLWRAVPDGLDPVVAQVTSQVVGTLQNPWEIARALSDYFTDSANGFRYTLTVPPSDTGDALADFLRNKQGFCQQYAAAMAVMLRLAGVPSRVVVGYTHVSPDNTGTFTVTTRDAHAWVEAYLGGVGWVSFDPTPLGGNDAARSVPLPWMHPTGPDSTSTAAAPGPVPTASSSGVGNKAQQDAADAGGLLNPDVTPAAPDHTAAWVLLWLAVGVVVAVLLGPALRRGVLRRRRRRVRGPGAAEARFDELRDLCLDLGLDWSAARSPRAVGAWLAGHGVPASMPAPLVGAVEQARYGRDPDAVDPRTLDAALARVRDALRRHSGLTARLRATWWPRSVVQATLAALRSRTDAVRDAFTRWADRSERPGRSGQPATGGGDLTRNRVGRGQ